MPDISLVDMLKSGVHFGHQKKRWHPKMKPYIFTMRSGIHIIDLEKTAEKLEQAYNFLKKTIANDGKVLFVSTKQQARQIVHAAAQKAKMPEVTERWIGGTLTNFENITKLTKRLDDLRTKKEKGELTKYTKLEQLQFDKEIDDLETSVGGIETLKKLPAALFIIDIKREKTALREARKKKIPVVAMVDTNCNPALVDYPIPANDDATKSIEYIVNLMAQAVIEGAGQKTEAAVESKDSKKPAIE